jgi:hypothetical protein
MNLSIFSPFVVTAGALNGARKICTLMSAVCSVSNGVFITPVLRTKGSIIVGINIDKQHIF